MNKILLGVFSACMLLTQAATVLADTIIFNAGAVVRGQILQTNAGVLLVQRDYGTYNYPTNEIKVIKREADDQKSRLSTNTISPWNLVVANLSQKPWATGLKQIPATVIDKGIFKNVPYLSFRCGVNYELNVYGDPDAPCGIEMGVYGESAKDEIPRRNCLEFIASTLRESLDKDVLRRLKLDEDVSSRGTLVFEVTPPTADDSYGGWWVSVYDEDRLNDARASDAEILDISEPLAKIDTSSSFKPNDSRWTKKDLSESRRVVVYYVPTPQQTRVSNTGSSTTSPVSSTRYSSGGYTGGSVYVKGYTRKDGTYVRPHTRSRPKR